MKILFLSRLYYPHVGGVEKHIFEISKRLINNGNTIIVVAEKHDRALQEKEILNGIEIYRIPVNGNDWLKKFKIWIWLWKNRELIKTSDIIHAHDVF